MKDKIKAFVEYVNRNGYFRNGKHLVEFNGNVYDVEAVAKTLGVCFNV